MYGWKGEGMDDYASIDMWMDQGQDGTTSCE